jgi:transcription termination/antitermination protein NusA
MKNEFSLAFNEILEDKGLPKDTILQAIESAMVSAYRRAVNASSAQHVEAKVDPDTGQVTVYAEKEIVEDVQDHRTEVTLEDALKVDPEAELGGMVVVETTPKEFGRVAAQTARQVIQQRIREAERGAQMEYFERQIGEIVFGTVQAQNAQSITLGLDMKAEGVMPANQKIPGERFRVHDRIRALMLEIKDGPRGPQITLSRAHRNFLRRLMENEVPEIYHGVVEIKAISREPGQRAKVAVIATQPGVDPVGACVGQKGMRIQAIVKELHDEKIDIIEWNADPVVYISKAISPARVSGVYLNEDGDGKTATVVVQEDQLSLAIGRDGQNARLAAKLTGWRIDIKSLPEAASETLHKVQTDLAYTAALEAEAETIERVQEILAKKAEGRPVMPEEYHKLSAFIERVERRSAERQQAEAALVEEARAKIPAKAFETPLDALGLPEHVYTILTEAEYRMAGDLMLAMAIDPDKVLKLHGIGPKAMQALQKIVSEVSFVEAVAEPVESEATETAEVEEVVEVPAPVPAEGEAPIPAEQESEKSAEEEPATMDAIFDIATLVTDAPVVKSDEPEDADAKKDKKGKKKKSVTYEYDPEKDAVVGRKKHKRGDGDWEEW